MVSASGTPKNAGGDAPSDKTTASKDVTSNNVTQGKTATNPSKLSHQSTQQPPPSRSKSKRLKIDDLTIQVPRKISGGNTCTPNQQLLVFVALLVGLLQMASKLGTLVKPTGKGNYQRMLTSPVNRSKQRKETIRKTFFDPFMRALLQKQTTSSSTDPCGIFLGSSSVPESGWGIFAGTNYTSGESIRTEHGHLLPIPSATSKGIPPWSLLIKPHSVLANVKWEISSSPLHEDLVVSTLVATREIQKGEEFFLSWEDHPYGPTLSDSSEKSNSVESGPFDYVFANSLAFPKQFSKADELIQEARVQYFGAIDYAKLEQEATKPKKPKYATSNARWNRAHGNRIKKQDSSQQLYTRESAVHIEKGLKLWQRAVETYDPMVSKLLPTDVKRLKMYHLRAAADKSLFSSSSLLGSLQNQTIQSLAQSAQCVSSFEWQLSPPPLASAEAETEAASDAETSSESCASSSHYRQIVTQDRGFSKGETVGIVPLLVMQDSFAQDPSMKGKGACIPLTSSVSLRDLVICPLGGIHERALNPGLANVEYRWSKSTMEEIPLDIQSLFTQSESSTPLSLEEERRQKEILLTKFPLSMSWDIVATRDLQQNDTVVIYQPDGIMPFTSSDEFETKIDE